MRVSLIGGTGQLGITLSRHLERAGDEITIAGRSGDVVVDIRTGEGLTDAVDGADVVVHLASDPRNPEATDIAGTANLIETLDAQHLIYVSIVGVDRHPFPYYQAKFRAEQLIGESAVAHTVFRATQFHPFVEFLLSKMCRRWSAFVPSGFVSQPVDIDEAATELVRMVHEKPPGLQPDFAGPEVLGINELARSFMEVRGREAPLVPLPIPGKAAKAFRDGIHTNPDRSMGTKTWSAYLADRFGQTA